MDLRLLRTFVVFASLVVATLASGQVVPLDTIDSIDVRVLNARSVVVGTVNEIREVPNRDTPTREVEVEVKEVLKGRPTNPIRLQVATPPRVLEGWQGWQAAATPLLVDVPTRETNPWIPHATALDDPDAFYVTTDFRRLRSPDDIRRYIRELVARNPGVDSVETYVLKVPEGPPGAAIRAALGRPRLHGIRVPVDQALERRAREWIRSKDHRERIEGAEHLRYFKSPANIARLRALLRDPYFSVVAPAETNRGVEVRNYPVRQAAYDVLTRHWGFTIDSPPGSESIARLATLTKLRIEGGIREDDLAAIRGAKSLTTLEIPYAYHLPADLIATVVASSRLTHLQLPAMSVDDAGLLRLAALRNLRVLSVRGNPISDAGLMAIASFPNLAEIDLSETEVTDRGLAELRRARPTLRVTPAKAIPALGVYTFANDIPGLRRLLDQTPEIVNQDWGINLGGFPLHAAAYERRSEAVRLLLERGASVNAVNGRNHNALQSAFVYFDPQFEIVQLLIAHGADVNRRDEGGVTPLVQAAQRGNVGLIRLLLACGADPFAITPESFQYARPPQGSMDLWKEFQALKANPVPIVPQTQARCERVAYALAPPDSSLAAWSTKPLGDFTAPLQWSQAPLGASLLGPLGQQSATLKLASLPAHRNVRVELDLSLIGSWDGNGGLVEKPDLFDISVPGVGTLLHSSFDNHDEGDHAGLPMQSFPDPYPFGFHRSFNGAMEVRSLGYEQEWQGYRFRRDATYRLVFTFTHASSELELVLSSLAVHEGERTIEETERWGIRRLVVKTDGPAP